MSEWLLWLLIVVIPGLGNTFTAFTIIFGIIFGVWLVALCIFIGLGVFDEDEKAEEAAGYLKSNYWWVPICFSVLVIFLNITPDKEQVAYIVGGYFVTNIEDVEKLPPNLVKSANKFLEDYNMSEAEE